MGAQVTFRQADERDLDLLVGWFDAVACARDRVSTDSTHPPRGAPPVWAIVPQGGTGGHTGRRP
ncbi:hypothetical protein [Streptomyces globisporus]|uniref:hypothetical protein n=1 Tax=Streptomyces globisporus TaxID=1908 RepID=UPI001900DEA2|nr:hypothetical protein [Streptomyces globisporus]